MTRLDALTILGLDADASPEGIRRAYLDLVEVWHPDRFVGDTRLQTKAISQLKIINAAYELVESDRQSNDRGRRGGEGQPDSARTAGSVRTPEGEPRRRSRFPPPYPVLGLAVVLLAAWVLYTGGTSVSERPNAPITPLTVEASRPAAKLESQDDSRVATARVPAKAVSPGPQRQPNKSAAHNTAVTATTSTKQTPAAGNPGEEEALVSLLSEIDRALSEVDRFPSSSTRPQNGEVLIPGTGTGLGALTIRNGTGWDAAVVLDTVNGTEQAIYVRAGDEAVMSSILPSTYALRFMLGTKWIGEAFEDGQGQSEFDQPVVFEERETPTGRSYSEMSVTLHAVPSGNATTTAIPAFRLVPRR